jgi:protein pelota
LKILETDDKFRTVTLKVEDLNDLWTLYNIISKNDKISARTHRRVVLKEGTKGDRKPMILELEVESVSFHEFTNRLRIKGKITQGPEEFVSFGMYHTFNVEIGQILSISKDEWMKSELKRLQEASKFESNFTMLIIAIETGLATVSLITNFSHKRIATINKNIPGKRYEQTYRNKAYEEFFESIVNIITENVKNDSIKLIILCGPGNVKEKFLDYIKRASKFEYSGEIRILQASSGTESAILEILKSKEILTIKKNIKVVQESQKIEEIFSLLANDPDLIAIGFDEVLNASEKGAVKELFCADILIRGASKEQKLKIENIIANVEKSGGIINILSSDHPTGEQIIDLGTLVAILRYKLKEY